MAEKKIVDVAGPKDAKVDIGSKPMIVGHKSLAGDPMVRQQEAEAPAENDGSAEDSEKVTPPSATKKVIAPISESDKAVKEPKQKPEDKLEQADSTEADSKEPPAESESKTDEPVQDEKKAADSTDEPTKTAAESATDEDKGEKIDPAAEAMEREEALRKLIDSKKYRVNIKQARNSRKGVVRALIILLLAGLGGLFYLADTDRIDLGFELPVNIFGKEEPSTPAPAPVQPVAEVDTAAEDTPEEAETSESERTFTFPEWFVYDAPGYTVSLPDGWVLREKEGGSGSLYSPGSLAYEEGKRAIVEEYNADSPAEGEFKFILDYMPDTASCEDFTSAASLPVRSYMTMDDLSVSSYLEEGTKLESERMLGELAVGERQYRYCVSDGNATIYVTYFVGVNDEVDDGKLVDSLVESVSFKTTQTQ